MKNAPKCAACGKHDGALGSFSIKDKKFYCQRCWCGFPASLRSVCVKCQSVDMGKGESPQTFFCRKCCNDQQHQLCKPESQPSTTTTTSTTSGTVIGTRCHQCKSVTCNGFPSKMERGKFFCAKCWQGYSVSDRDACSLCHKYTGGYFHSHDGGIQTFMCTDCIARKQPQKPQEVHKTPQELLIEQQRKEDEALLREEIDFATLMERPGCRFLDEWLEVLLLAIQLRSSDVAAYQTVVEDVRDTICSAGLRVELYGSMRTGLAVFNSDFDFFVKAARSSDEERGSKPVLEDATCRRKMDAVAKALKERLSVLPSSNDGDGNPSLVFKDVETINAQVPLVRATHCRSGAFLDFSFSPVGVMGTEFLCSQLQREELRYARPLIVLVKLLLRSWGLGDATSGGICAFAVALMVIWFLKQPEGQAAARRREKEQSPSLCVLMMAFCDYYSTFDSRTQCIDVLENKIVKKSKYCKHPGSICLRHPIQRETNAANGCDKYVSSIQPKFQEASVRLNHLARMKWVMKTSVMYTAVEEVVLHPLSTVASKQLQLLKKSGEKISFLPQHQWIEALDLYCGGLAIGS